MPVEYEGLVGKQGEKASELFERSKTAYQESVANHRPNDLALACPLCRTKGSPEVRLFSKPPYAAYCVNGHQWKDNDELMALAPDKLAFRGIKARQEGWEKLTLEMPGSTLKQLQEKYKDKLPETLTAFLEILTNPRFLFIGEEDLVRTEQNLGIPLRNGRDLAGATWERAGKIRELQEQAEKAAPAVAGGPSIPGVVMVNVIDVYDKLKDRAATGDPPRTVEQFLTDTIREYVKNDWF